MLRRCYEPYTINRRQTYQDVFVCKEWLNFQNFAEWFHKNYYELLDERVELDKDIIKRENKIYCPEFCSFVPQSINLLLVKCDKSRGKYPIGVCFDKSSNKFIAQIAVNGKQKYLRCFCNPEKTFLVYKKAKEEQIKIMINKYIEVLDNRVYNSLVKYKILITD